MTVAHFPPSVCLLFGLRKGKTETAQKMRIVTLGVEDSDGIVILTSGLPASSVNKERGWHS